MALTTATFGVAFGGYSLKGRAGHGEEIHGGLMKKQCIVALMALPVVAAPAFANEHSAFEFKGITAGKPISLGRLANCRPAKDDTTECYLKDRVVAGKVRGDGPKLGFIDNQLIFLQYRFNRSEANTLLDMLYEKYGPDSTGEVANWSSKPTKVTKGDQLVWRFETGLLTVTFDDHSGDGELLYSDFYRAKPKAVKPDF